MLNDFCDWYVGKMREHFERSAAIAPRRINVPELVI
jgi:hypothetical protein